MPDPFDAVRLAREWLGPFYAEVEWDRDDDQRELAALLTRVRREALEEAAGVLEAKRAVSERARQRTPADSTKTWNYYNVRCVAFGEAAHDLRALIGGESNTGHASYDAAYQDRHTTMERPTWGECSECGVAIAWEDRSCPQCEGSEG